MRPAVGRPAAAAPAGVLGTVARVQLQRSRLKPGERGARRYTTDPLLEVPEVEVGPRGLRGTGELAGLLDVHHADHPDTRNVRLRNSLSLLPRAHYAQLRERFGPHVADGTAGESLLLDTDGPLTAEDLAGTLLLDTEEGDPLVLTEVAAAPPCVEFSRWCAGSDEPGAVEDALAFLASGRRGFYARVEGSGRVAPGARLTRA